MSNDVNEYCNVETFTWHYKIGMGWYNSTRNNKLGNFNNIHLLLRMSHLYATLSSFWTPANKTFFVGMSDAGIQFHAYQLYLVSVLHDSTKTRVQLLSAITKTKYIHDRTIPYSKMTAIVELMSEI